MNAKLHLPVRIGVARLPPKDFEVIHNWTSPATILLGELHGRRRPEEALGGPAPQLERFVPSPVLARAAEVAPAVAHHLPVVPGVPLPILTEPGYLVLIAKRTPVTVGVEVAGRVQVRETNDLTAFHRLAGLAERHLVPFPDLPQTLRGSIVGGGGHELLPASRLQLSLVAIEEVLAPGFNVGELDSGPAGDIFLICGNVANGAEENRRGKRKRSGLHLDFTSVSLSSPFQCQ